MFFKINLSSYDTFKTNELSSEALSYQNFCIIDYVILLGICGNLKEKNHFSNEKGFILIYLQNSWISYREL